MIHTVPTTLEPMIEYLNHNSLIRSQTRYAIVLDLQNVMLLQPRLQRLPSNEINGTPFRMRQPKLDFPAWMRIIHRLNIKVLELLIRQAPASLSDFLVKKP